MTELTGLVLCGGRSRRMGRDKATLEWEGSPLYEVVVERLRPVCREVILAPGRSGRLGATGLREVDDPWDDAGPLGGIVAGLSASTTVAVAVVGADMPRCDARLLAALGDRLGAHDVVMPQTAQGIQPLHAVWSSAVAPRLVDLVEGGTRSVREALSHLDVTIVGEDDLAALGAAPDLAFNINSPADLPRG